MQKILFTLILSFGLVSASLSLGQSTEFRFEEHTSITDMRNHLKQAFPPETNRQSLHSAFVTSGGATLVDHPEFRDTVKYVYDINLCNIYIWRWNISADFDLQNRLKQIYLNGEPIHESGPQLREIGDTDISDETAAILKAFRPRPEAVRGENQLAYVLLDLDTKTDRAQDEFAIGAGPSRADPNRFGKVHIYESVERWRSIFDDAPAKEIAQFRGNCP